MHVVRVRTVSLPRLFLRLVIILLLVSNSELERRLSRKAYFMRHSASWISQIAKEIQTLWSPYWLTVGPREWLRVWRLVAELGHKDLSVSFLVYRVGGLSGRTTTKADMMLLISSREILQALVPSRDHAIDITKSYDIELGKKK